MADRQGPVRPSGWRWSAPVTPRPDPTWPPLPKGAGPLIWIRLSSDWDPALAAIEQLRDRMIAKGMRIVISDPRGKVWGGDWVMLPDPGQDRATIRAVLDYLKPMGLLLMGADLPVGIMAESHARKIPIIMADARFGPARTGWAFRNTQSRMLCTYLSRVLVPDQAARDDALRHGCAPAQLEITGTLLATRDPLRHLEPERQSLAESLTGRQLWLAACLTPEEEPAVINAHLTALRHSHRAMLIALPAQPGSTADLAARMTQAGLIVAERMDDDDLTDDVNAYLCDDPIELGLLYRLCPVTFMGGTLAGSDRAARDPFEPALLGSAIIRGPQIDCYDTEWRMLGRAGATHQIRSPSALPGAVTDLIAPDRAAQLATNAWTVVTSGAAVATHICNAITQALARKKSPIS